MHARSIWRSHAFQKSKFENLSGACITHAYVCNLEIMLKWNELLCSREIVNRHFESKECFSAASCKVLCEFLTEAKISVFVAEQRLYNFNTCLQCLELRWDELFPRF